MTEMPNKTMTDLRMFCISFPTVLNTNHSFSNFKEILTHFDQILKYFNILYLYYYDYSHVFIIIESKKKIEAKGGWGLGGTPTTFL
jgi:hypothetical protein